MKLSQMILSHGLQKTLLLVDERTKTDILNYIPVWIKKCEILIEISKRIFDITQGKRNGHFWVTTQNKNLTYGEVITKMLDLDEELSKAYTSDWVFSNIMNHTETGNWDLQNRLTHEFTGARFIEYGGETSKMNHFMKGQRDLKWMIIHVVRFIEVGKSILRS